MNHIEFLGFISNASMSELADVSTALADALQEQGITRIAGSDIDDDCGNTEIYEAWQHALECASFIRLAEQKAQEWKGRKENLEREQGAAL